MIEDNAGDVGLIREALRLHEIACDVTVIEDGERAITFMDEVDEGDQSCPDLVILDLNLPRRSGTEVLKRIRASNTCPEVPIIVLTSSDNQKDKDEIAALRAACYLHKPPHLTEFMQLGEVFKRTLFPVE